MRMPLSSSAQLAQRLTCSQCGETHGLWEHVWRCVCGAPLHWAGDVSGAAPGTGVWRHADLLPPVADANRVTLGEPVTPLVPLDGLLAKVDALLPSGSFKDRGAATLASWALEAGVREAVVDSSGNAGAAISAYFAAAGVPLTVFVPRGTSAPKQAQTRRYGSTVVEVDGGRDDATAAACAHAERTGAFYASHAWSPFFLAGLRTLAAELADQADGELPPVVVPTGAGTALLGLRHGFALLRERGAVARVPQLFAVQAARCAPLANAFARGSAMPVPGEWKRSIAEGINVTTAPRGADVLSALRATAGGAITVTEDEIAAARDELPRHGILVETTSAAAWAGACKLREAGTFDRAVVLLTGTGLKEAQA